MQRSHCSEVFQSTEGVFNGIVIFVQTIEAIRDVLPQNWYITRRLYKPSLSLESPVNTSLKSFDDGQKTGCTIVDLVTLRNWSRAFLSYQYHAKRMGRRDFRHFSGERRTRVSGLANSAARIDHLFGHMTRYGYC